MGRKNRYESHVLPYLDQIPKWFESMTEYEIAAKLGVSTSSFEKYKTEHPELVAALKSGKEVLIEELKDSLKMRARGFHYKETKRIIRNVDGVETKVIEEYEKYSPPDTGAIHLLLKNLDDNWRNEDRATMDLKREKMELEKTKAEEERW